MYGNVVEYGVFLLCALHFEDVPDIAGGGEKLIGSQAHYLAYSQAGVYAESKNGSVSCYWKNLEDGGDFFGG